MPDLRGISGNGKHLEGAEDIATPASRPCSTHPHLHGTPWEMVDQHKRIRKKLSTMAPRRAAETIRAVGLPEDEETCVIDVDVFGRTCVQTAAKLHISVDGFYKLRRRAYQKLADAFNF